MEHRGWGMGGCTVDGTTPNNQRFSCLVTQGESLLFLLPLLKKSRRPHTGAFAVSDRLTGVLVLAMSPSQEGVWLRKAVESNQVGLTAVFTLSPSPPTHSSL